MSKAKYDAYVAWFARNKNRESLNLRLSSNELSTRSMRKQFIMLQRRYHPWTEELNRYESTGTLENYVRFLIRFILMFEQSGIFIAWGERKLEVDVKDNPNEERNPDSVKMGTKSLKEMLLFLVLGLNSGLITFICEVVKWHMKKLYKVEMEYFELKQKALYITKFTFTLLSGISSLILILVVHLTPEATFPAVIGI